MRATCLRSCVRGPHEGHGDASCRRVATSRGESVSVVIRVITSFFSNFLTELQAERAGR